MLPRDVFAALSAQPELVTSDLRLALIACICPKFREHILRPSVPIAPRQWEEGVVIHLKSKSLATITEAKTKYTVLIR